MAESKVFGQGPVRYAESSQMAAKALPTARSGRFAVDTQEREAVRNFFNAVFYSGAGVQANWDGNVANCQPGSTSMQYQEAVLTRINFYRAMAGVPADITLNPEFSAKAAAAALIVSANASITHTPPESFSCYTPQGRDGAENSNVALGTAGVDSIEAYMLDAGPNFRVGHRRWLLYPQTREMGNGDIDPPDGSSARRANANWVFDGNFAGPRPETRDGFVAWPPRGFVPHKSVYPRWSFSFPGANFAQANVSVSSNGVLLPVYIEDVAIGYGEESIVFVPGTIAPDARKFHERPTADISYAVNVSNVIVGNSSTNFSYTVTVFDPTTTYEAPSLLIGSSQPEVGRTNRFRLSPALEASAYVFRVGELVPYHTIEGADNGMSGVTASISTLYPLIQSAVVRSAPGAFHLAHTSPPRPQSFTLRTPIVSSPRSELRFQSRLGAASTGQVARVQISVDDGSSWRDVFSQNGDGASGELGFSQRVVSLQEFAGRAILVRFEYGFPFGSFVYAPGFADQVGWYVDDIQVTFAQEFSLSEERVAITPEFGFVPSVAKTYYLDGRAIFYDRFGGEWTAGATVSAVPANDSPPQVEIQSIELAGNFWHIKFHASNVTENPIFRVEGSNEVRSDWVIIPQHELQLEVSGSNYIYHLPVAPEGMRFFRISVE